MAKFTAKFDLQDRISKKLEKMVKRLETADKLAKRLGLVNLKANDGITPTINKVEKRMKSRMMKEHTTRFLADSRGFERSITRLRDNVMRRLGKEHEYTIRAKDETTRVISRINSFVKRSLGRGYTATIGVIDRFTTQVNRMAAHGRSLFSKTYSMTVGLVDRASGPARKIYNYANNHLNRTFTMTVKVADLATRPLRKVGSLASNVGTVLGVGAGAYGGIVAPLKQQAARQNMTTAFETLLGSRKAAEDRLDELVAFAGATPFTRDEIFEASRVLQIFTDGAIATGDGLKLVGDVAAGTQQPFGDVALWIGRLYDGLESGRPIGDAAARLQEMGAISGKSRARLEELAESGQDISVIWPEVTKEFERFDDMMVKMSDNLANLTLGVKSFVNNSIIMPWGKGLANVLEPALAAFREWRGEYSFVIADMARQTEKAGERFAKSIMDPMSSTFGFIGDQMKILFPGELTPELEEKFKEYPELEKRFEQYEKYRDMTFKARWDIVWENTQDVFGEWWRTKGQPGLNKVAENVGSTYGGILNGIINGIFNIEGESSGNAFVDAGMEAGRTFIGSFFEALDPIEISKKMAKKWWQVNWDFLSGEGSFGSAAFNNVIAGLIIGKILSKLKWVKGIFTGGSWVFKQLGKVGSNKPPKPPKGSPPLGGGTPPKDGGRAPRGFGNFKLPSWLKKAGRRVPYLGPLLAGSALIGGDRDRLGANLGGLLGGIGGGAATGAAVGSIVPGVGTTIGAIVGGIAGAFGGEKIGEWIQNSGILEKISDTLFNGEWWREKWNSVTDYAKNLYEGSWLQDTITAIGDTLFSSDWWSRKWDGVTDFVDNKLLNASWWAEQAGYMYGYLESTVFSSDWWSQKWTDAGEWASNLYEGSWLEKTIDAINDTIFNKEWWGQKWIDVKGYAKERWHYWDELGNEVAEKLDRTIFNKEWWGQQWQNVKDWASQRWQFWEDLGNEVAEKLDRTIFNKEWWGKQWENVKAYANERWHYWDELGNEVAQKLGNTIFNKEWWSKGWEDVAEWGRNALKGISDWWEGLKSEFQSGREQGQAAAAGAGRNRGRSGGETRYANGGFINRPHLGLVGEAGPEVIIPLSSNRRGRALDLYQKAGAALGVRPYANGGIVGGSVKMPNSQPVQASVNVGSVSVQADKQAKQYGEAITAAVASGINDTVVPINNWRKNNIETPMDGVVKEAVGFGSSTVRSFSTGQNATPTKTDAHLDRQVRSPFRVIQGGASQWGTGTVTGFRSGQDSTATGTRTYLMANVHTPFDETKGKGRGWGSGTASEFVTGMRSQSSQVTEAAKYLAKQVEKTFKEELGIHSPSRVMMALGRFASLGIVKGLGAVDVKKFAEKQAGSLAAAFAGMGSIGGSVAQWIQAAMMITGVPSSWLGPLSVIAQKESGGNPRAINLWDINAKRGIPSKGLMQTIDPTFNAYKMKGMDDIYNPIHNAVAAIRYIQSRYGNVFNVPGIRSMARGGAYRGYANGGLIKNEQIARVGEGNKREWIIPAERGIRGRYLLHQAAADLGMSVVDQGASETVDADTVQVATRPSASSKVVVASEPSVQLIIHGDQHFYYEEDKEAWFKEMEKRLEDLIREARQNGASEVY